MKKLVFTYLSILCMSLPLVNCSNKDSNNNTAAAVNQNGLCAVGQVNTQMGCLPQGNCPAGYGASYGQCYPQVATNLGNNGLVNTPYGAMTVLQCQQTFGANSQYCYSNTGYNNGWNNGWNNSYQQGLLCPVGQVNTTIGCLTQNSCPVNYGYYNGYCYPAMQQNNWNTYQNNCVYKSFYWYCTPW